MGLSVLDIIPQRTRVMDLRFYQLGTFGSRVVERLHSEDKSVISSLSS